MARNEAQVRVSLNAGDTRKDAQALAAQLRNDLGVKLDVDTSELSAVDTLLQGIGQGIGQTAFGLLANTLSVIPGFVAQNTLEFERFRTVLTTTLGTAEKSDEALAGLREFAATTPFQLNEVVDSFIKLQNRGITPTNEVLKQLGDLASSQGKSLNQITEAILDATSGEFERLKEFGIQASSSGDKVTLAFKGVNTEVAKTPQAIADTILGFGKLQGVAGGMEAQSKTLGGQLSNLQDNLSKAATAFGDELVPVLLEFVQGLNTGGQDLENFARSAGENTAVLLKLLADILKVAADNSQLLSVAIGTLTLNFVALKASAAVSTFVAMATGITQAQAAALGFQKTLLVMRAALLANVPAAAALTAALGPLLVVAAGVAAISFAKFTNDLREANEAIAASQSSTQANTESAISAAFRTKNAVQQLNAARQQGRQLTQQEIEDNRRLVTANDQRLTQLRKDLESVRQLQVTSGNGFTDADEAQQQARQAQVEQIEQTIRALEGQNKALISVVGTGDKAAQSSEKQATALEKVSAAADKSTAQLENSFVQRQTQIQEQFSNEEDARQESLKAEGEYLSQRLALNRENLEKLKSITTTDPKEREKIEAEILKTERQISKDRLEIAKNTAAQREEIERQALEKVERANREAERVIANSQIQRTILLRQSQLRNQVSAQETANQLAQIEQQATKETIKQKDRELAEIRRLRQQGTLDAKEAADREADINQEIGRLNLQRIEQEFEQRRRLQEQAINRELSAARRPLTQATNRLNLQSSALSGQLELLNAQRELVESINTLEQERLNTQILQAEKLGDQAEVERLRQEQTRLTRDQLDQQFAAQARQLELQFQLRDLELERERIAARRAELEARAELRRARAAGATEDELADLQESVRLAQQNTQITDQRIQRQQQLNQLERDKLATQQQTTRERQRQEDIRNGNDRPLTAEESERRAQGFRSGESVEQRERRAQGFQFGESVEARERRLATRLPSRAEALATNLLAAAQAPISVNLRPSAFSNEDLIQEIRNLKNALTDRPPQQTNNFTLINESDPYAKTVELQQNLLQAKIRGQGL